MITKVLFGVAMALSAALATADPAGADPSVFGVLSCSCEGPGTFMSRGTVREQIDAGIQNGLTDLLGSSG